MAKTNKPESATDTESVVETPVVSATPETAKKKETATEHDLKYGQCIVAPADKPENEILTTIDDWHTLYNSGKNQGKFILKAEKKSC